MKSVYLSGPISLNGTATPDEIAERVAVFTTEAKRLREAGYEVVNPCEVESQKSWADYMKVLVPAVCAVDAVATLPGWELSRGARLEVYIAKELGIAVQPVENVA